jgi:hypothetical protein
MVRVPLLIFIFVIVFPAKNIGQTINNECANPIFSLIQKYN